ncbi:MAG TPA: hypothetical protein PLN69_08095 [bacterium]|nr:hypothetical protein [bacterium]
MIIRKVTTIIFLITTVVNILLWSDYAPAYSTGNEQMSSKEVELRRKKLNKIPEGLLRDYDKYFSAALSANHSSDYDKMIFYSEKALGELEKQEWLKQAETIGVHKESVYSMTQYAMLAAAYDRKGYCFHAYRYYNKFIDAKNSDFTIIGLFTPRILNKSFDSELYEHEKPVSLKTIDMFWVHLPFKRCIPEKLEDNMYTANESEAADYEAFRPLSRKMKRIFREYYKCKGPVIWGGDEKTSYLERRKTCSDIAVRDTGIELEATGHTSDPRMRKFRDIFMSHKEYGAMKADLYYYISSEYGYSGPIPRLFRWTMVDN